MLAASVLAMHQSSYKTRKRKKELVSSHLGKLQTKYQKITEQIFVFFNKSVAPALVQWVKYSMSSKGGASQYLLIISEQSTLLSFISVK